MKTKKNIKSIAALFLCVILMLTAGCAKGTEKEQTAGTTSGKALAEMNDIPADGIITKEQFQSVAGKEQKVQFKGTTEDGITYVWTYDCAKIQNPEDQNLKIDFTQITPLPCIVICMASFASFACFLISSKFSCVKSIFRF